MSDQTNIERLYQEWFAAGEELFRTNGALKFAQRTLQIANALLDIPEFKNEIEADELSELQEAMSVVTERHSEIAPQIDLTNPAITTPEPFVRRAERALLSSGLKNDYKPAIDLVNFALLVMATLLEKKGFATPIPPKAGEFTDRYDNYLVAIRTSMANATRRPQP